MSFTALAKSAEIAWVMLESYSIDPAPLFREAGIDPNILNDPSARVSQSTLDKLWSKVSGVVDDPCFGVKLGNFWHPSYMHALGYAWLASTTLRSALNRLVRFIRVVNQALVIEITEENNQLSVSLANPASQLTDGWRADGAISILMCMCRVNYGESLDPVSVHFKHSKPICAGDYYEYFRSPIEFDANSDRLVLASEAVDKRLTSSNPLMSQINDNEVIKYLAKLDANDIVQRTKAVIIEQLPDGRVSDIGVAEELNMSNRTLQRKLNEKGTTYKNLLTEVRKELALKYIQNRQLTLTELSFQLGFSEMSSFSRAFKQWTGQSPRTYRKPL